MGGSAADVLDGGLNDDRLNGGDGIDVFVRSDGNDIVEATRTVNGATRTTKITGDFLGKWFDSGGEAGTLGNPLDDMHPGTGGVRSQKFNDGFVYDSSATGILLVSYHLPVGAKSLFANAYDPIRSRLLRDFFYNGFIADSIWTDDQNKMHIKFGDQGKQMGDTLLAFAQEAAILQAAGFDPSPAEDVVQIMLHAFDQLDRDAEQVLYQRSESGFFVRDYIGRAGNERQGIPDEFGTEKTAGSTVTSWQAWMPSTTSMTTAHGTSPARMH